MTDIYQNHVDRRTREMHERLLEFRRRKKEIAIMKL